MATRSLAGGAVGVMLLLLQWFGPGCLLSHAVPLRPVSSTEALEKRAWELVGKGEMRTAIIEVTKALASAKEPWDQAELHELLGDLEKSRQGVICDDCIREYLAALSLDSANARLLFKSGAAMFPKQSTRKHAVLLLERSLEMGYTNSQTFYLLGADWKMLAESTTNRLDRERFLERAIERYKSAVLIDPNNVAAHGNLADIYFNMGEYRDAAFAYRDALSHPMDVLQLMAFKSRLADTETRLEHFDEALRLLAEADGLFTTNRAPAQLGPRLNWSLEGLRLLNYKLETLEKAGRSAEAEAVLEPLLARAAEAKRVFEEAGALPDPINAFEARAYTALRRRR